MQYPDQSESSPHIHTQELTLGIPVLSNINDERLDQLYLHGQNILESSLQQRRALDLANVIGISVNELGLGDANNELRYARIVAEQLPNKEVVIAMPNAISEIPYITLPENVSVVEDIPPKLIGQEDTFFISFNPYKRLIETLRRSDWNDVDLRDRLLTLKTNNRLSDYESSMHTALTQVYHHINIDPDQVTYNLLDAVHGIRLHLLDMKLSKSDLDRSLYTIIEEDLIFHPVKYRYLIAPDAKESPARDKTRSRKSLSPDKWEDIFRNRMRSDEPIGIVQGTSHPQYCEEVYERAKHAGLQVVKVRTDSLTDFGYEVLSCRTFVGMDSGTTHIASEMVQAAKAIGRKIHIREIFNSSIPNVHVRKYGIRGLGGLGRILNYRNDLESNEDYDARDLDHIPAETVALFIQK